MVIASCQLLSAGWLGTASSCPSSCAASAACGLWGSPYGCGNLRCGGGPCSMEDNTTQLLEELKTLDTDLGQLLECHMHDHTSWFVSTKCLVAPMLCFMPCCPVGLFGCLTYWLASSQGSQSCPAVNAATGNMLLRILVCVVAMLGVDHGARSYNLCLEILMQVALLGYTDRTPCIQVRSDSVTSLCPSCLQLTSLCLAWCIPMISWHWPPQQEHPCPLLGWA